MKNITINIIQDTRRAKRNGAYPIKLRVIFDRKVKYYPTKENLTKEDYSKVFSEKPGKNLLSIRDNLFNLQSKAKGIVEKLHVFSFKTFESRLFKVNIGDSDLEDAYKEYIGVLKLAGRVSTAVSYECSIASLKKFRPQIKFAELTVDFLREYEGWMLNNGNSLTSVGIYLRALRSVFNEAIADEKIAKELYPFGRRKYQIPTGKNTKKALHLTDIKKIYSYKTANGSTEEKAKDFWLFSYLCNGINMKDIARLKNKDIHGDFINFSRAKTERSTRSNPKPISFYLNDSAKSIIERWGNKNKKSENYVFPILEAGCTPEREMKLIQQFIKTVNKWINVISKKSGIEKKVTTYTARHSFSTILKRSGASIDYISEALGHSNIRTTENYLDSFEDETKREYSSMLLAFKED